MSVGDAFLMPTDTGTGFGVVLGVFLDRAYVRLQSGHAGTVPLRAVEAWVEMLNGLCEEDEAA